MCTWAGLVSQIRSREFPLCPLTKDSLQLKKGKQNQLIIKGHPEGWLHGYQNFYSGTSLAFLQGEFFYLEHDTKIYFSTSDGYEAT